MRPFLTQERTSSLSESEMASDGYANTKTSNVMILFQMFVMTHVCGKPWHGNKLLFAEFTSCDMAGRVFLAVFLCLAAIMEDQIKVEGWELEALEESLVCYKPTREICGVGTVTAVSRSLQKGEMIIYTRNEKAMMCVQTKIFILSWYLCQTFGGVDSKYRNTAVVFTPFGRCLRVNWESSNTARKEKRKKQKEKRSTRKKISYDHAAPQVWKKH